MLFEAEVLKVFALVMVRVSGLVVTAPFLGSSSFPPTAKAGLIALTAVLITPTLPKLAQPLPADFLPFGVMALSEFATGALLGFVMTIVFAAVQLAGEIVDMLSGFAMMNVFNPALETQVPIFGFFFFIVAVLFLLAVDGHHVMIRALVSTYRTVPLGSFALHPQLLREVSTWGGPMFRDALLIASPATAALLVAYATMGILGRAVPQIHLFVVGFPITIAIGLIMVALILRIYVELLAGLFQETFRNVAVIIRGMS